VAAAHTAEDPLILRAAPPLVAYQIIVITESFAAAPASAKNTSLIGAPFRDSGPAGSALRRGRSSASATGR
jgi:hypothetical protein